MYLRYSLEDRTYAKARKSIAKLAKQWGFVTDNLPRGCKVAGIPPKIDYLCLPDWRDADFASDPDALAIAYDYWYERGDQMRCQLLQMIVELRQP